MKRLMKTVAEVEAGIMTDPEAPGELDDYDLVSLYGIKRLLAAAGELADFRALESEIIRRAVDRFDRILAQKEGELYHE